MADIEELKKRILNAEEIKKMVKTMKILSAVNIRQYEKKYKAMLEHFEIIQKASFFAGISLQKERRNLKTGYLLIGSDMGICGKFNEILYDYFRNLPEKDSYLIVAGEKAASLIRDNGGKVDKLFEYPKSLFKNIFEMIDDLIVVIDKLVMQKELDSIKILYNKLTTLTSYNPCLIELRPLIKHIDKVKKFHYLSSDELRNGIARQYIHSLIYMAFLSSLITENQARMIALQTAEKNIDDLREMLILSYNSERQNLVTSETLDVIAGAQVILNICG